MVQGTGGHRNPCSPGHWSTPSSPTNILKYAEPSESEQVNIDFKLYMKNTRDWYRPSLSQRSFNSKLENSSAMRFIFNLLALSLTLVGLKAQTMVDGCPKEDIACLDVINSSQCLEQLIIEHDATVTKDAMIKCVDTEGASSNMTGSAKVSFKTPSWMESWSGVWVWWIR